MNSDGSSIDISPLKMAMVMEAVVLTPRNRNPPTFHDINMELLRKDLNLRLREPRVREHADLIDDVFPGAWRTQTLQLMVQ